MPNVGKIVVISLIVLAGCATPENYQPKTTQISIPELNRQVTVSVGDSMVRQGSSTQVKGIELSESNNIGTYKFSAGFYPQTGENQNFTFHSFQIGQSYNGMGTLSGSMDVESLRADKRKQQLCVMSTLRAFALGMKPCDTEHGYTRVEKGVVGPNNFQQSLLYSGRVGNKVRISYREFSGDLARPAYSNDVEYDLSSSDTVTYKGARIKIINADNEKITYIVLNNFNTTN